MKIQPEDYNEFEMYHKFPCLGTNGMPRFDARNQPETITGTVTYRLLKKSVLEKWKKSYDYKK